MRKRKSTSCRHRACRPGCGRHAARHDGFPRRAADSSWTGSTGLRTSDFLRAIYDNTPDAITIVEAATGRFLEVNRTFTRHSGWARAEVLGKTSEDLGLWGDPEQRQAFWDAMRIDGVVEGQEAVFIGRDGRRTMGVISGRRTQLGGRNCVLTVSRDVTESRQLEQHLRDSRAEFERLFELVPFPLVVSRADGAVDYVNVRAMDFYGVRAERLHQVRAMDFYPNPEQRAAIIALLREHGRVDDYEALQFDGRGRKRAVLVSARPVHWSGEDRFLFINYDITERKQAEEERRLLEDQMRHAQKMESLGLLAGGIAHDFNNLLTAIFANLSLAERELARDTLAAGAHLREAERAGMRARDLTRRLLTIARGGPALRQVTELEPILREAARLALSGSPNRLQCEIAEDLWPVFADPGQVAQVISNLVLNADQATPQDGEIRMVATNEPSGAVPVPGLTPGHYVRVSVVDRGVGIESHLLPRIFDPFFTTKRAGSGLGLATVHSIVTAHGGVIRVQSKEGFGSSFHVWLPAAPSYARPSDAPGAKSARPPCHRVLVLEDDAQVRQTLGECLRSAGHEVDVTATGEETLRCWQEAKAALRPYDLLLLDLHVEGGMSGRETLARLRAMGERVTAIATSADARSPLPEDGPDVGFAGYLPKPFHLADLEELLADLLKAPKSLRSPKR